MEEATVICALPDESIKNGRLNLIECWKGMILDVANLRKIKYRQVQYKTKIYKYSIDTDSKTSTVWFSGLIKDKG